MSSRGKGDNRLKEPMTNPGLRGTFVPGLFLLCSGLASAATLTVTSTNDSGAGSLRSA
jgi:hypothetical protein